MKKAKPSLKLEVERAFKALGEPTRLVILRLLAEQELCVCELEEVMDISQPRISHHLKVLREAGLIAQRREAQRSICSLNQEGLSRVVEAYHAYMTEPLSVMVEFREMHERLTNLDGNSCERKSYGKACL
ncbi:MAG: winged helix-turn-helix transcriptional regulator [Syntrophomonadaceae bacterium]|jgi:ArsR family transcriptional regulator|nr:winged helix-turn-helix transcriptional regulator [Syntrophomonadaceae bacterium]